MPWNESTRMDERRLFVEAYFSGRFTMAELCRSAGVSRPTGYLWVERYRSHGEAGLWDRSHAVRCCPHRTPRSVVDRLIELRRDHPFWGPRKLRAVAHRRWPGVAPGVTGAEADYCVGVPAFGTVTVALQMAALPAASSPR